MAKILTSGSKAGNLSFDIGLSISFGRDPRNTVHLEGDSVSRFHAEIRKRGSSYMLVDLGSSNGTFLNGKRIEREVLEDGDKISIGAFSFFFDDNEEDVEEYRPRETTFRAFTQDIMKAEFENKKSQSLAKFDEFISLVELCAKPVDEGAFYSQLKDALEGIFEADFAAILAQENGNWGLYNSAISAFQSVDNSNISGSVVKAACEKNEGVLMEAPEDNRFRMQVSIVQNRISTAIAVPFEGTTKGVLYLHRLTPCESFTKDDFRLLFAVSIPVRGAVDSLHQFNRIKSDRNKLRGLLHGGSKILGNHSSILYVRKMIAKVAPLKSTVLITGSTGTGKELAARALHDFSPRANEAFEAVNCAAITDSLVESELFGHEKGAFTGAIESRSGAFELADSGTLFLDEIGELTPGIQAKLLRVIENREVKRVGGTKLRKIDVRLIAATNRNLEEMVEQGKFRADLYFRVKVVTIELPDLSKRREDIPLLVEHFLKIHSQAMGIPIPSISRDALESLISYSWRGNVRELKNVLERATILCEDGCIESSDLAISVGEPHADKKTFSELGRLSISDVEKIHIQAVLEHTNGNKTNAASILGIDRSTLYAKLKMHGLK